MNRTPVIILSAVLLAGSTSWQAAQAAKCSTSTSVVTNEKGRIVKRIKTRTCR